MFAINFVVFAYFCRAVEMRKTRPEGDFRSCFFNHRAMRYRDDVMVLWMGEVLSNNKYVL